MSTSDGISPSPHNVIKILLNAFSSFMNAWQFEAYVLLSLLLHVFLFIFASERRRTNRTWLVALISSAHFLADWVAPYTIGLMSADIKCQLQTAPSPCPCPCVDYVRDCDSRCKFFRLQYEIWASSLLLHLGGPDNVTSFSAEENNMWLQQLVRLISQTVSTILIFIRYAPFYFDWAPCVLFLAGTLRYMERVHSLYLARSGGLKESSATRVKLQAGSDFQTLSETERAMREANLPIQAETVHLPPKKFKPHSPSLRDVELLFDTNDDRLGEKSLLQFALCFYNNFKGLFFGGAVIYSHEQRQFTRNFFLNRSSRDAFKLAELELGFIHKDLHTKSGIPHLDGNPVLRITTTLLISAAAILFYNDKSKIVESSKVDGFFYSTELLRFMPHGPHLFGLPKLLIDLIISYALVGEALILEIVSLLMFLLSGRNVIGFNYYDCIKPIADTTVKRRKWSESFSKCNFICYHLHYRTPRRVNSILEFLFIGPALEASKLKRTVTSDPVSEPLKDKIFTELKMRSQLARTVEIGTKLCSQRGDWTLIQRSCYRQLKWSIGDVGSIHSFLLWHIATDLVCHSSKGSDKDAADQQFCKDISEYLLYLYLAKPTILALAAGNSEKVFQDTVLEAKKFFQKRSITDHAEACQAIVSVNTDIKPVVFKGDANESVFFDACRLAKQLLVFKEDKRWSVMSGVWMELLTYAAFHSKRTDHAHQPSQGGELLTFVWLLMNHLGLGKHFEEERGRTAYRIVVGK